MIEMASLSDEGILWNDLAGFHWNLTEAFQGPEKYPANVQSLASLDVAMNIWKSLNTCIAHVVRVPEAQKISDLAALIKLGLKTLPMALEHSPDTFLGRYTTLHAPVVRTWLHISGNSIDVTCKIGAERLDGDIGEQG
ncbi:hypothetical protein T440DRAFT_530812 [Plenodomus tracheiphilus IPT5]|uniref:Uncharacterized protein n=1 Tax=Plenodomus tracheiphilus IPT5 TaxID=1408161 RepID=A0A6A7B8L7_9PLEO|nr:hypothetical protein T440DRAFT_530812 [Plenodomus tracheiphilus IPT5]